jgi:hypothetical protein
MTVSQQTICEIKEYWRDGEHVLANVGFEA